jgi:hypothetical protein
VTSYLISLEPGKWLRTDKELIGWTTQTADATKYDADDVGIMFDLLRSHPRFATYDPLAVEWSEPVKDAH